MRVRFASLPLAACVACLGGKPPGDAPPGDDTGEHTDSGGDSHSGGDTGACAPPDDVCDGDTCTWNGAGEGWTVSGALRFNGAPLGGGAWTLVLTEPEQGLAWSTAGDGPDFSLRVATGRYDVTLLAGADTPFPGTWPLASGVEVTADVTKNFEATGWTVSGVLRLDGEPLPEGPWSLQLVEVDTGLAYTQVGDGPSYTLEVPTGRFDVVLTAADGAWRLAEAAEVSADVTKNFDLALYDVEGALRFDGAPLGADDGWALGFADRETGLVHTFGGTGADYTLRLPAGTYDVTLTGTAGTTVSGAWRMASGLVVSDDCTKNLDVDVHTVSGTVRFDGAALAAGDSRTLRFVEATTGESHADTGSGPAFALDLPTGEYTVQLLGADGADDAGAWPLAEAFAVSADTTANFDVAAWAVVGTLRLDGAPLGGSATWTLDLVDDARGLVYSAAGAGPDFALQVPEGVYDVLLHGEPGGAAEGDWPLARGMPVSADVTKNFDVAVWEVVGALRFDGVVLPDAAGSPDWTLRWTELGTGLAYTDSGDGPDFSVRLPAGLYDVTLDGSAETSWPGTWPLASCVEVGG